jgi:cell fate regulator YaaT (PSP1 superfamily)
MNRDDRIDEEQEEQHNDGPGQPTAEGADRGLEDSPAAAETVDEPATGDASSATQAESGDTGSEWQTGPVDQREEEAPADEQALDSSRAADATPATEREQDETGGHAGPVDHVGGETPSHTQSADELRPEEAAYSPESQPPETSGREMTMADAELPGTPHGGDVSSRTRSENQGPSFSDLQAAPGAREEEEAPRPRVVIAAGTDERSLEALKICREKARQLHVRMHPLAARYDDERHVTIFFRSDDKVDFRKLVRELSRVLRARIEMRQLGPREQGKLCGLIGKCGYPLCCQTFLGQFTQSSIKMAKTQDLALNPLKISGVCGRLLCCLNYEQELYAEVKSRMPKVNRQVDTEFGPGRVSSVNVLKETVTVQFETMTKELPLDAVQRSEARG